MPPDPILGLKINGKKYEYVITFSGSPKIGKNLWERNPETKRKATFYHSWQRAFQLYNSLLGFGCEFGGGGGEGRECCFVFLYLSQSGSVIKKRGRDKENG